MEVKLRATTGASSSGCSDCARSASDATFPAQADTAVPLAAPHPAARHIQRRVRELGAGAWQRGIRAGAAAHRRRTSPAGRRR